MTDRFPNYNVLSKRDSMSWNDPTRRAIDERLSVEDRPEFFSAEEYRTLRALCERIIPQPDRMEKVPIAAHIDRHLKLNGESGTRYAPLPYDGPCWKQALAALDAEATAKYGMRFHELAEEAADGLLQRCQEGKLDNEAWGEIPPGMFFKKRVLTDIPGVYYSHPAAWSEMGFGGPASPRGYVRLEANKRDPWEATEAYPGKEREAAVKNASLT